MADGNKTGTGVRRGFLPVVGRLLLAAVLAFLFLEAFCRVYFNRPIHTATPGGPTDYIWEPHAFYSCWTEGIGFGKTNNEGYYDLEDRAEGETADVLIMGSSFMQAEQVPQNRSTAALLRDSLPEMKVYNIGVAGHRFLTCVQNTTAACEAYRPRYLVIDTQEVGFTDEQLAQVLEGSYPEESSVESPLLLMLKRSCVLNLLYYQMSYYREEHGGLLNPPELQPLFGKRTQQDGEKAAADGGEMPYESARAENRELLRQVLQKLHDDAAETGTEVIVLYHPKTWLDGYGGMLVYDAARTDGFDTLCEECGIRLLDMAERYRREYDGSYALPYGFPNTAVGTGHLNAAGHRMIAEDLKDLITEMET